jgi:hypothetical protein
LGEQIRVGRRPVNPNSASVRLSEKLESHQHHPSVMSWVRIRDWMFDLGDGGPVLEWTTRQTLSGGFELERTTSRAELLARRLASASGWTMPSIDATEPDPEYQ